MTVISNTEHYTLYGIDVTYYKDDNIHGQYSKHYY